MPNDLIFQTPQSGNRDLVFGDIGYGPALVTVVFSATFAPLTVSAFVAKERYAEITGSFAPLTVTLRVAKIALLDITGSFAALQVASACTYDNRVTRYLHHQAGGAISAAESARPSLTARAGVSKPMRDSTVSVWRDGGNIERPVVGSISTANKQPRQIDDRYQLATRAGSAVDNRNQAAYQVRFSHTGPYGLGVGIAYFVAGGNQAGDPRRYTIAPLWQTAKHRSIDRGGRQGASLRRTGRQASSARWQHGMQPHTGRQNYNPIIVPPVGRIGDANLLFVYDADASPHLVFHRGAPVIVPPSAPFKILPARFYMTVHTVYAQRLPDLAEVPIFDATVSADAGSYCWTLAASGPASLFAQLAPEDGLPVQLRVMLDGIPWVFAVDSLARSSAFGKSGVSISGRSVTALIGAPYLRAVARGNASSDRTAQQLAMDALDSSGVDLDWGLTDWLVNAGAWSHQGTALDAVQTITQAAGGYLQSHRSAPTLLSRHPYGQRAGDNPGAPWEWMTGPADVELAPDAIITDGTERRDGPDINAVYVSGTSHGVLGLVKRSGTAADKLAAMVTDPLITHVDAARQRGLAVLGAAGHKYNVRLELPVLTGLNQPGVLDVGQLVQINTAQPWRGRVRSISVNARRPSLRQTITLERHLETV